jgi:hypothetical protein
VGNRTKEKFFKGRSANGPSKKKKKKKQHMKKMLTIPGHKGNANQNHTKILPHSY